METATVMVVDDDHFYHEFCKDVLEEQGYRVRSTYTGEEALEVLKNEPVDAVLVDLIMPGMNGMEILDRIKQLDPNLDVIIMTGHASVESAVQCLKSGAADYLTKPINPEALNLAIKRTIELRHLFDENLELRGLVTLYETCQRVSLCLDLDKLYRLSLDAVGQALTSDLGAAFFRNRGEWETKAVRGIEEGEAGALINLLAEKELDKPAERVALLEDLPAEGEGPSLQKLRAASGLVIPVTIPGVLQGVIAAFRSDGDKPFDQADLHTARFIAEQIHLSFENAVNYSDAQRLVFIDDLTGLFNTRYLDMALKTELKRAKRFKSSLSLLFVDLDFFKNVNDTYGHLAGSKLLIETAKVLKSCVRDIDIVVRYGGDEFIVILIETDKQGASKVAERIRQSVEEHTFRIREDLQLRVTCCVGIATSPDDTESKSELIHLADKAMYRGKETTRNVVYAASSM